MNKLTLRTVPALMLAAFSSVASAAAFQLWEQNASGLGNAYAGSAAVADNASTVFFNPAGMSELAGYQVSLGVVGVGPSYEFQDGGSSGVTMGSGNGGDAGGWHAVPNLYLSGRLTDKLSLGFGVSSPFGLATEYDSGWIGKAQTIKSEIRTVNYNPSLAYRINDKISLGFGVNYQKIDAELTNSLSALKGDDSAWGWNVGALFKLSPAMRVGVSYRSSIKYTLEGTLNGSVPVKADVELPDTAILSVWQQVSDRWEAMGDISYTRWSTLNSLNVLSRSSGATLGTERFNYDNSWRVAWGAAYKASDAAKIKFGIAYDRTPVNDTDRSARVPDNSRLWLSLGGQWNAGRYGKIDAGYSYLYVKDSDINMNKNATLLRGSYDASAHIVGVQYSVGF
ncbi:outer membrane protein transport protein [Dechloromonas sp. XY25]|uniref:Outer membrane protein transport protein n=1 Tax=Dechloromonas hankyongensis TaxID=2908002 RepID=A0ABS9JZ51_9RHOO|nr:outer membrane protein transport protein [Dechloromonas hankyongensis]MCG2576180.1 outer membrane protein transport protein [Dechloromonas hankyongensis]